MWMVPHTVAGIAIVSTLDNPALSLPLAFVSHYVLDFIPHWTQKPSFTGKEKYALFADFFLSLIIGVALAWQFPLFSSQFWVIIAGAALGNLPDAIRIPYMLTIDGTLKDLKDKKSFMGYLERFHEIVDQGIERRREGMNYLYNNLVGKAWIGVLTQVLVVIISLYIIFR